MVSAHRSELLCSHPRAASFLSLQDSAAPKLTILRATGWRRRCQPGSMVRFANKLTFPVQVPMAPKETPTRVPVSLPGCLARKVKPLRSSQFLNVVLSGKLQLCFKKGNVQSIIVPLPRTSP